MDFEEESSISKINTLVNTFRDMCCEKDCLKLKDVKSRKLGYTNFTVHEIMKPNFGGRLVNCDSDSDGTYHSESGSGWNSSGDESHDNDEGRCGSACSYYYEGPVFPTPVKTNSTDDIARPFSIFQRFKQQFEEDGYSSSDSESALDLRIARKKTPPKLTKQLPAWVFCTRYSDRPSAGRRPRKRKNPMAVREKRSRIAFNDIQLRQLNIEFEKEQYLSEDRRHKLADELDLNEANVKIWFQNKRAKLKKEAIPHPLAVQLKEEGLYNHKLVTKDDGGH